MKYLLPLYLPYEYRNWIEYPELQISNIPTNCPVLVLPNLV